MNNLYDDLPPRWAAINKIMQQPFYGKGRKDIVIQYIYSHAYWYVGDNAGLAQVRSRCASEVVEMENSFYTRTGKRLSLC